MHENGTVRGHHLFLTLPDGALKDALTKTIHTLSAKYDGPIFEPHLTIAAQITAPQPDIEAFARELAKEPAPFITFQGMKIGDTFFKCCYLAVELSPELAELNRHVRERFAIPNVFDPHISLVYGRYAPEVLQAMAQAAEDSLAGVLSPTTFPYLELWETEGEVKDWKRAARYVFSS